MITRVVFKQYRLTRKVYEIRLYIMINILNRRESKTVTILIDLLVYYTGIN